MIEEFDVEESRIGRPSKQLRLALGTVQVLGATLGVRETRIFAAGLDGVIAPDTIRTFATPLTYDGILTELTRHVQELRQRTRRTLGLGMSVPGLLNEETGQVIFSPNLHQTDGRPLADDAARRIGIEVTTIQESRALCLAERVHGGAKELRDFLILDISEGVGVGIVLDGRVVLGRQGLAGEFGHMTVDPNGSACGCGNHGCLETIISIKAICRRATEAVGRPVAIHEVVNGARADQPGMRRIVEETLPWLAIGLATLINGFNPEAIFIHGPLAELDGVMLGKLTDLTQPARLAGVDAELPTALGPRFEGAGGGGGRHRSADRQWAVPGLSFDRRPAKGFGEAPKKPI